jgi:hypothetical protein
MRILYCKISEERETRTPVLWQSLMSEYDLEVRRNTTEELFSGVEKIYAKISFIYGKKRRNYTYLLECKNKIWTLSSHSTGAQTICIAFKK